MEMQQEYQQPEVPQLNSQDDEVINSLLMLSQQQPMKPTSEIKEQQPKSEMTTPSRTNVYNNQNILVLPPIQTVMSHHHNHHGHHGHGCCGSESASPSMMPQTSPFEELIKAAMSVKLPQSPLTPASQSRKRTHSNAITIKLPLYPQQNHQEATYHESDKKFHCDFQGCGKSFGRIEHLKRHLRIHTGQKDYVCKVPGCPKTFNRSDNLLQHMKTHLRRGDIDNLL